MATDVERLVYQMSADIRRFEKSLEKATKKTDTETRKIERRFDRMNKSILSSTTSLAGDLRAAVAGIGVAYAIGEVTKYADAWTNLRNATVQYSDVIGDVDVAISDLADLAIEARVALGGLQSTFAASARASKDLNLKAPREEIFAFNEAVAKGAAIANTGTAATEGALRQLGQAISSPRVQLEEFNSVIEGTPRLAQAFADGIDDAEGSVAKLRELIAGGRISGSDLFAALNEELPTLRDEFAKLTPTVESAVQSLETAFTRFVGQSQLVSSSNQALAQFILVVADNLPLLANAAIITTAALAGMAGARGIQAVITGLQGVKTFADLAAVAATRMGAAFKFLGGPLGLLLGTLAAGLAYFALQGQATSRTMDEIVASMRDLAEKTKAIRSDIESDAKEMESIYDRLKTAMENQSAAAAETARVELQAVAARKKANEDLLTSYQALSAVDVDDARKQLFESRSKLLEYGGINIGVGDFYLKDFKTGTSPVATQFRKDVDASDFEARQAYAAAIDQGVEIEKATADLQAAQQKGREQALASVLSWAASERERLTEIVRSGQALNADQIALLESEDDYLKKRATYQDAISNFQSVDRIAEGRAGSPLSGLLKGALDGIAALSDVYGDLQGDVRSLYETERQEIDRTLAERISAIEATKASEAEKEAAKAAAREITAEQIRRLDAEEAEARAAARAEIEDAARKRLDSILEIARARKTYDLETARDLAEASGDETKLAAMERELSILSEMDRIRALGASGEQAIRRQATESVDRLLSAEQAVADARQAAARDLKDLEDQLEIARAAGQDQEIQRLERVLSIRARIAEYEGLGYSSADASALATEQQDQVDAVTSQVSEFQRYFRDAFRNGVREGIATGDWGQALQNIFADAATKGLERALDNIADVVFNLFRSAFNGAGGGNVGGSNGWLGSAVGGIFSYAGARASGGGVSGGSAYRVNEQRGEILYMPKGQNGTVMSVDQAARALGGGGGGTVFSPQTSIVINGGGPDVAAQIATAMNQLNKTWAAALPRAIDARVIDSRGRGRI